MKTVRIDGRYYDITANVRKTDAEEFVYSIQLNESEIKRASPPIGFHEKSVRSGEQRSSDSIAQNGADVNSENEDVRYSLIEYTDEIRFLTSDVTYLYKQSMRTQKKKTYPRRQVNKPLSIRPKRTAV